MFITIFQKIKRMANLRKLIMDLYVVPFKISSPIHIYIITYMDFENNTYCALSSFVVKINGYI